MTIMMAKDLFPAYEVDCEVITTILIVIVYYNIYRSYCCSRISHFRPEQPLAGWQKLTVVYCSHLMN
mgnify:CR=1 FL=1